jgi:hypothetical protein
MVVSKFVNVVELSFVVFQKSKLKQESMGIPL